MAVIGRSEAKKIAAALRTGKEIEIHMESNGWNITIRTAPAPKVWNRTGIVRVYAKSRQHGESGQWLVSEEEVEEALKEF